MIVDGKVHTAQAVWRLSFTRLKSSGMGTQEGGGKERQVEGANSETGGRGTARVGTCPARVGTYQKSQFEDKRPKWRKGRMVAERCHFDGSRVQSVLQKGSRGHWSRSQIVPHWASSPWGACTIQREGRTERVGTYM